jgi:hypothetical protein
VVTMQNHKNRTKKNNWLIRLTVVIFIFCRAGLAPPALSIGGVNPTLPL